MLEAIVDWMLNNLTALTSILLSTASVGLTAALVVLYRQQQQLLRIEKLPEIEIADREIDGDQLDVVLSNYGHGLAKDVRFCTSVHAPDADGFEPMLVESRARRVNEDAETTLERSVRPQQVQVTFRGEPSMGYRLNGEEHRFADFSTGFEHLHRADIHSVWFQVFVVVDDQLDDCQMKPLFWPARNAGDIAKEVDVSESPVDLERGFELGGLSGDDEPPEILTPDCRE